MLGGNTCECCAPIRRNDLRPPQKVAGLRQRTGGANVTSNFAVSLTAPASAGCLGRADSDLISASGLTDCGCPAAESERRQPVSSRLPGGGRRQGSDRRRSLSPG